MGKGMKVAIGSDGSERGKALQMSIERFLDLENYSYEDFSSEKPNYEIAHEIAKAVVSGKYECGIVIDDIAVASAIAANKVIGARAFTATTMYVAAISAKKYKTNVLCLGYLIGDSESDSPLGIVRAWLNEKRDMKKI